MIRLLALACGLLCGAGFLISGLYDPGLAHDVGAREGGPLAFSAALFAIVFVAAVLASLPLSRGTPCLGGHLEDLPEYAGRKTLFGALVFGVGWGLSGYFPLAAIVSAAALSPGAVVFLASAFVGMVLADVATGKRAFGSGSSGKFG
jgi:uncharacterized membrane protein YedE/YeeE